MANELRSDLGRELLLTRCQCAGAALQRALGLMAPPHRALPLWGASHLHIWETVHGFVR